MRESNFAKRRYKHFLLDKFRTIIDGTSGSVRKVDVRPPGEGNSNSDGARPVHQIITMTKWTRTSRWSTENSLSTKTKARIIWPRVRVESITKGRGGGRTSCSSLLTSNLAKSDQLLTTYRSPSTDNQDSFYRHPANVLG